ncbi:DUF4270 domain-containing protein [Flavobacterium sp. WC2509]|uniref:DUF4270 domain-containing protein n=1 Tax=Flavobacterium sp. WC2509 TaxID=3461406 RepID=UPI00404421AB
MLRNSFFKTILLLFFIVLFNSCDKEFSVVGEDIIVNNSFGIVKGEFPVVAYNEKIEPIQSNNLEINPLGIYDNPSFGTTKASFVTQVALASLGATFSETAEIKSAVLSIPYFYDSSKTVLNSDGVSSTYLLDSIYGPNADNPSLNKMKLSVYESGYNMTDLDPNEQFSKPQKYYSNQYPDFYGVKKGVLLNDSSNAAENGSFFFNPAERVVTTTATDGTKTTTRLAPAMTLNLNADFFQQKIIKAPSSSLANNQVFKEYFKGLFFDVEKVDGSATNMAMINFKGGVITLTYTEDKGVTEKTLVIQLSGNTVSLLDQSNTNANYTDATKPATNIVKAEGVPNLYLKGGEGSMSVLKLFGDDKFGADGVSGAPNGVADQLDILRTNKCLVNQAELTFYLNSDAMGTASIPQRIFLYDFKNSQVVADYVDVSTANNSKNNKYVFGGILDKETATGALYYKFRITDHVRNLVKYADSTNVDLGLVVTEDINKFSFYSSRDKTAVPLKAPMASVMNPLGAIVFGNNIPFDDKNYKKRLKFVVYYTKAN